MTFYDELQIKTQDAREALFAIPIIQNALQGRITKTQYLAFLKEAFHHVKHTVPLLKACEAKVSDEYTWLKEGMHHYIEDEKIGRAHV